MRATISLTNKSSQKHVARNGVRDSQRKVLYFPDTQVEGLLSWAAYNPEIEPSRASLS